jgi:hypothetical protein
MPIIVKSKAGRHLAIFVRQLSNKNGYRMGMSSSASSGCRGSLGVMVVSFSSCIQYISLPVDHFLALPEATRRGTKVAECQHDRSLCTFIGRLCAVALGHVGVDVARATGIDQDRL